MIFIVCVGLFFILLSGIINVIELKKFFKALGILNMYTISLKDKLLYPIRFIGLIKYLGPVLPDVLFMGASGAIGLGGGVLGSIIAMGGTCMITLLIKLAIRANKPKDNKPTYKQAMEAV